MQKLLDILKESRLDDYEVVEQTTVSHQAFFIGKKLDQHRISDTRNIKLTVYMDKDGKRGSASREIFPSESEEEIRSDIEEMKFNALLALNPYFELVKDSKHHEPMADADLLKSYRSVIEAVNSIEDSGNESINSYEVFVEHNYYHIVNSQGVDVSFNHQKENVEVVINSVKDGKEFEIYHMVECGADQTVENIVSEIKAEFRNAADRSNAVSCPTLMNAHVIITGTDLEELFRYFISKTNTRAVYNRMSQVQIGDVFQKGSGDKITIKAVANLPYSSNNRPYSLEGRKISDFLLTDKGKYAAYNGDSRTAYYLGLKDVCPVNNFVVEPGSRSLEEMQRTPYLKIVQFSGLDVNPITGDFGGEFRLAYLYDGKTVTPVTSGSITSNMLTVLDNLYLSKETVQLNSCVVPAGVELFDINVAGK